MIKEIPAVGPLKNICRYFASDTGTILGLKRSGEDKSVLSSYIITEIQQTPSNSRDIHPSVQLRLRNNFNKRFYVADIVLITFKNYMGDAYRFMHHDNDPQNNDYQNLYWVLKKNMGLWSILDEHEIKLYTLKMNAVPTIEQRNELNEAGLAEFIARSAELADPLQRKIFFEKLFKI